MVPESTDPLTNTNGPVPRPAPAEPMAAAVAALLTAMRANLVKWDPDELADRAARIVAAACETEKSQCVVLTVGGHRDAQRLADAVVLGIDPLNTYTTAADVAEAGRVIERMVANRG